MGGPREEAVMEEGEEVLEIIGKLAMSLSTRVLRSTRYASRDLRINSSVRRKQMLWDRESLWGGSG